MNGKIFPLIIIALSLGVGVVYLYNGDLRHTIYWFAAATLNIAVTF